MTVANLWWWSVPALVLLAAGVLWIGGRLNLQRSVLVHAPGPRAWEFVRHPPSLLQRHARAGDFGAIETWETLRGDGASAGSIWKLRGRFDNRPWWAEVELVTIQPPRDLAFRLRRDALGTHRGLGGHRAAITLDAIDENTTRMTWRVQARGMRLLPRKWLAIDSLRARLLDIGLRSLKMSIESGRRDAPASAPPPADLHAPPPGGPRRTEPTL